MLTQAKESKVEGEAMGWLVAEGHETVPIRPTDVTHRDSLLNLCFANLLLENPVVITSALLENQVSPKTKTVGTLMRTQSDHALPGAKDSKERKNENACT